MDQCASELYTLIADTVEDEDTMDELLSEIGERNGVLHGLTIRPTPVTRIVNLQLDGGSTQ